MQVETAYTICILVGFIIPLFSLLMGSIVDLFDGLFDGISTLFDGMGWDFDFSFDIGDITISVIPASIHSICAGLLVFGTAGKLIFTGSNYIFANVVAGVSAYILAMAIQTLLSRLKRVRHSPLTQEQLQFCDARVTNTIIAGGYGAISISTGTGARLSYPAKTVDAQLIRQDTPVYIIRFDKNVAIVKKAGYSADYEELKIYD